VAVGDIGRCDSTADEATAKLAATLPGPILLLGDLAYERGSTRDFADCYATSWGGLLGRSWAAPGNHEHITAGASAYFDYFGERAGPDRRGWYSIELGAWHVISLDSECAMVGGCGPGSVQDRWLVEDLAAHPSTCLLAFWHRPRFSSGVHGSDPGLDLLWRTLAEAGADIVLTGHDHGYERFDTLGADGAPDPAGVRQFVVGTGGAKLRRIQRPIGRSAFFDTRHHGLLALTLTSSGYAWNFLTTPDGDVLDAGSGSCHGAAPSS
jgi:alkaline phosphatase